MKYIVVSHKLGDMIQEIPIIFPNNLVHAIIAKHVEEAMKEHNFNEIELVSAGDICFGSISCGGDSKTLKVESRIAVDEVLIYTHDYTGGLKTEEDID